MSVVRLLLGLGLLCSAVSAGGCLAVAGAAGVGSAYALGEETMYAEQDVAAAQHAVIAAFEDYGVTYAGTDPREDGVYVRGFKYIEDDTEDVVVGVWRKAPGTPTKLEIRIGTIGKKDESIELMALIRKHLDATEAGATPPG